MNGNSVCDYCRKEIAGGTELWLLATFTFCCEEHRLKYVNAQPEIMRQYAAKEGLSVEQAIAFLM